MARRIRLIGICLAVLVILSASAQFVLGEQAAQTPQTASSMWSGLFDSIVAPLFKTALFGVVGLVFILIAYRVIDLVTPFDLNKEIAQDDNVAAGILAGAMMLSLAIILHAAIASCAR
ncbi:MAG TPA: DUF350 domain-containing protein [Planctomycetota bacterium]|nr:DUF350 domain-containing protein [Planctomycetota bacterium]